MLRVAVGDGGAATDTGGLVMCTNVPAHVVTGTIIIIRTLHVVIADDLTLGVGSVVWTVLRTLVVARY